MSGISEPTIRVRVPAATVMPSSSDVDLLGSGADVAFVIYAMQIQQLDGFVRQSLNEVQQIQKLRTAMNDQLAKLREVKAVIADKGEGSGDERHADFPMEPPPARVDFSMNADGTVGSKLVSSLGQYHFDHEPYTGKKINEHYQVSNADVEKEINRLQGIAQGLDGDREIKMIMMNSQLNKKEQAVTQLTNFIKKASDTQSAIVNNLR